MLSDILDLSDRELGLLLDALSRGTIRPGVDLSQVRKAGLTDRPDLIQLWLAGAMAEFGSTRALTAALRLLRADRARSNRDGRHAELIMTGPAIGEDSNRDTRVVVREIFESVKKSALIVGYAFVGSDAIFEPLARRMGQDSALTARIIVNIHPAQGRAPDRVVRQFAGNFVSSSWPFHPRPEIYYLPDSIEIRGSRRASVHAKLIVADEVTVYLGSANFTTAAFRRNIEVGIRLKDATLGNQLTCYFEVVSVIHCSKLASSPILTLSLNL